MKSALVVVLLGSSLLWAGSGSKQTESLIITNVNVVDTRYGNIQPNLTVIIENGVVKAVAKVAVVDPGPHTHVINAAGKYLVPGFWDMNAQVSNNSQTWDGQALFALYLANGVIGLREAEGEDERMRLVSGLRDESTTSSTQPAPDSGAPLPERRPSDRAINDIYAFLRACCSHSTVLMPEPDPFIPQDDNGPRLEADLYDPDKAMDVFHELSDRRGWVVPSLVAQEAPIASVSDAEWASIDDKFALDRTSPHVQTLLQQRAHFHQALQLAHEMIRAGVQLLAGTNGPRAHLLPGRSLHRELQLLVKTGCTPFEALQSATYNAAAYVEKADRYGVVEAGHVADLVLLDGDPLQDISNTERISGVILEGKYFSRIELDRMAAGAERSRAQASAPNAAP